MKVQIEQLIRKASLMMGETPCLSVDADDCEGATLADRLRLEIGLQAAEALAATPREKLTGWRLLDGEGLTTMEDGSALLPLPSDFLLLHTLRLAGWERSVTGVALPDSREGLLQAGRWEGLRGTAGRPVAVLTPHGSGMALRLYGAHSEPPEVAEGWYLPVPHPDSDDCIELPEATVAILLETVVAGVVRKVC